MSGRERKRTSNTPDTFRQMDGFGRPEAGRDAGSLPGARVDAEAGPESGGGPGGASQPARQRSGRKRRPRWQKIVDRAVQDFTTRLKEQFTRLMADERSAREIKKCTVIPVKLNLPPRPGRPSDVATNCHHFLKPVPGGGEAGRRSFDSPFDLELSPLPEPIVTYF